MHEIDYYLSTNADCMRAAAETMVQVTGKRILYESGAIVFPADFACGKFKYYELAEGLSVLLIDCVFYQPIKFVRAPVKSNDYHLLHFDLTGAPVVVNNASGNTVDVGSDWKDAVFYSSTGKGVTLVPPVGHPLRAVLIIANKTWFAKNFPLNPDSSQSSELAAFSAGSAFQFTTSLSIKCLPVVEEMLVASLEESVMPMYLKGSVLRLIAQFNVGLMACRQPYERPAFETATRVMQFKEKLEEDWTNWSNSKERELPFMTTTEAAQSCHTSRTTFCRLFLEIYNTNFKAYFDALRIHVAAEMLQAGAKPLSVAIRIGYQTLGGFSKEFKRVYSMTPAQYRARYKPNQNQKKQDL